MPDLPPFAHIPGQNTRHPEDWFDTIKASVTDDIAPQDLHHTAAFQAGLLYLKKGYFWECHEVLEAVWLRTPDPSAERDMTQALIQLANARLKILMERSRATRRLIGKVLDHLDRFPPERMILGLKVAQVRRWAEDTGQKVHYIAN